MEHTADRFRNANVPEPVGLAGRQKLQRVCCRLNGQGPKEAAALPTTSRTMQTRSMTAAQEASQAAHSGGAEVTGETHASEGVTSHDNPARSCTATNTDGCLAGPKRNSGDDQAAAGSTPVASEAAPGKAMTRPKGKGKSRGAELKTEKPGKASMQPKNPALKGVVLALTAHLVLKQSPTSAYLECSVHLFRPVRLSMVSRDS